MLSDFIVMKKISTHFPLLEEKKNKGRIRSRENKKEMKICFVIQLFMLLKQREFGAGRLT